MSDLTNPLQMSLRAGLPQIGLWLGLADPYCAEICAGAGFDWLLIDGEHAPNDLRSVLAQLQALAGYPVSPVVRLPIGEGWLIKQYLDLGVQSLLIPMVETAEQARALVSAVRYPPRGVRGVGSALARASHWNRIPDYLRRADDNVCLLVQIESGAGLANLDEIAATEGIDGLFIGPADLSASLGHLDEPNHPEVHVAIDDAVVRILRHGKAAGILATDETLTRHYLELGCTFVAVGVDTSLMAKATQDLAAKFRRQVTSSSETPDAGYGDGVA